MTPTLESLGIDKLSVADRIALAQAIWDSVAAETEPPALTDAQKKEIDRRLAAHAANPSAAVPWEQVEAAALARISQ
ncbi:addiction module protein [Gemmata sp.]|uniref:addiction module protein n=1 Tax=Gemmata sp. TaxID=1914242 RepID=UPI003F7196CA